MPIHLDEQPIQGRPRSGHGAVAVDGKMVDKPVLLEAQGILEAVGRG